MDYFISHHWAEDFGEFVQSVLRHAIVAAPELSMAWKDVVCPSGGARGGFQVRYWCCAFANNQHQIALGAGARRCARLMYWLQIWALAYTSQSSNWLRHLKAINKVIVYSRCIRHGNGLKARG